MIRHPALLRRVWTTSRIVKPTSAATEAASTPRNVVTHLRRLRSGDHLTSLVIVSSASRRRSSSRMRVSSRTAPQAARRSALARSRRSAGLRTSSAMRNSLTTRASFESVACVSGAIAANNHEIRRSVPTGDRLSPPTRHVDEAACLASSTMGRAASRDTGVPSGVIRVVGQARTRRPGPMVARCRR